MLPHPAGSVLLLGFLAKGVSGAGDSVLLLGFWGVGLVGGLESVVLLLGFFMGVSVRRERVGRAWSSWNFCAAEIM